MNRAPYLYKPLLSRYFYHDISFYFIFLFHIVKSVKYKATFVSCLNFLNIVFESLQGCKLTFKYLLAFSGNTNLAVSLEDTIQNIASCNRTNTGCLEQLTHFRMTDNFLLKYRIKHTLHGSFYIFDCLINNSIQTKIYTFLLSKLFCGCIRTDIKADNDRI